MEEKKNIEIINGDGTNLDISPAYDHLNGETPKPNDKRPKNIVIPKIITKKSDNEKSKKDNEQEEEKKEVEVPNIIGMTEKEAKKALEDVGLQLEFKKSEEKETITDQLPKAGIKTKSGTIIIAQ